MSGARYTPAFPEPGLSGLPNGDWFPGQPGMSLRDYFAGQALAGLTNGRRENVEVFAREAYAVADAMLAERDVLATVQFPEIKDE